MPAHVLHRAQRAAYRLRAATDEPGKRGLPFARTGVQTMRGQLRLPVVRWSSRQVGLSSQGLLRPHQGSHPGHKAAVLWRKAPPWERGHRRGMQHTASRRQGAVGEARPVPPLRRPALQAAGRRRTHHQESRHAHGGLAPSLLLLLLLGPPDIWLGLDQNGRHVRWSLCCGLRRRTADGHEHRRR